MEKIFCKNCKSPDVKKNGFVFGRQRYKCKVCGCQFTKITPHGKDATLKMTALALYEIGLSKNKCAQVLGVTVTSVIRWLKDFKAKLHFTDNTKSKITEIEESKLRTYIKNLYVENRENFLMVQNVFDSDYEVDVIIKKRKTDTLKKHAGILVCAFGDSVLQGTIRNAKLNRYEILPESFVTLSEKSLNVVWKNYARPDLTVFNALKQLEAHMTQVKESDYIFFCFGGQESQPDWDKISADPLTPYDQKKALENFHNKYVSLIEFVQKKGKTPLLYSLPPIHAELWFKHISAYRNEENLLKFLNQDIQNLYRWHSLYNLEIFKIAGETNVPVIDVTSYFLALSDYQKYLSDGMHPNAEGHALIAKALQDFYKKYITE